MRALLAVPVVLLLVSFALSNRAPVTLGLWPTDLTLELPLSAAILGGMAAAFFVGAAITWFAALGHRRRASRAEAQLRMTQKQLDELRERLPPALPPP